MAKLMGRRELEAWARLIEARDEARERHARTGSDLDREWAEVAEGEVRRFARGGSGDDSSPGHGGR